MDTIPLVSHYLLYLQLSTYYVVVDVFDTSVSLLEAWPRAKRVEQTYFHAYSSSK